MEKVEGRKGPAAVEVVIKDSHRGEGQSANDADNCGKAKGVAKWSGGFEPSAQCGQAQDQVDDAYDSMYDNKRQC